MARNVPRMRRWCRWAISFSALQNGCFDGTAQLERDLALWRTIEALRHYAATHGGHLPPNLTAIKEVPIPLDPLTGKDFRVSTRRRHRDAARSNPAQGNSQQ